MILFIKTIFFIFSLINISYVLANNNGECKPEDCWKLRAKEIEDSIDITVDPCENFYEFACGRWIKKNLIPHCHETWTPADSYKYKLVDELVELLNSPIESTDSLSFNSAKNIFRSCMNTTARDKYGFKFFQLIDNFGGWPILNQKPCKLIMNESDFSIPLSKIFFNVDAIFDISLKKTPHGDQIFIGDAHDTPLKNVLIKFNRNSTEVKQYMKSIVEVAKTIADDQGLEKFDSFKALRTANDIVNFQLKLIEAEKNSTEGQQRNVVMTVHEFQEWFDTQSPGKNSYATWVSSLKLFWSSVTQKTQMVIGNLKFIENTILLINETPAETLQNFIVWQILFKFLRFMPTRMYNIQYRLENIGRETRTLFLSRERRCIEDLPFQHAVIAKFIETKLPENFKTSFEEMIKNVSETSQEYITNTSWISPDLKKTTKRQIVDYTALVNYPNWYNSTETIDQYYGNPEFDSDSDYVEDRLLILQSQNKVSSTLTRMLFDTDLRMDSKSDLKISKFFQGAILSVLKWILSKLHPDLPAVINYGTFATSIASELSNVFSSITSSLFGKSSNNKTVEWPNEFFRRLDELQMQFNNATNAAIKSNDKKNAYELLYDNFGLPAAFSAYEKYKTPKDVKFTLPNYPAYSDRKLFFISYANSFCSSEIPVMAKNSPRKYSKYHQSINSVRLNLALSNFKEFSDAFSCSVDSPMNPVKKINVFGSQEPKDETQNDSKENELENLTKSSVESQESKYQSQHDPEENESDNNIIE